jgi:hypothetical protein
MTVIDNQRDDNATQANSKSKRYNQTNDLFVIHSHKKTH